MQKFTAAVIDDEELCRNLLTEILEERGYRVTSFDNALAFLNASGEQLGQRPAGQYDFLLTDNLMPGMTGLQMLEEQRELLQRSQVRRQAIVSGSWTLPDKQKAITLGCKTFAKPFDLDVLNHWLDECEKQLAGD